MSVGSLGQEMAAHSSVLAWKPSCREEPAGLQSMRPGRKSWTGLSTHTFIFLVQSGVLFQGGPFHRRFGANTSVFPLRLLGTGFHKDSEDFRHHPEVCQREVPAPWGRRG